MLESNSHKFIGTIGAIVIAVLLILGGKVFFASESQDLFFKVATPDQTQVKNVGNLLDGATPQGAQTNSDQISYTIPAIDHPAGTSPWDGSHGGLAVYHLNLLVPYHQTLTYTFQLYVKTDPSIKTFGTYLNISNRYEDGTSASGDDLDAQNTVNQRVFSVNNTVATASQYSGVVSVPTNQWNTVTVSYVNNSELKRPYTTSLLFT